ncbi:PepSY-associated TM helix domain-containing protein [Streptomonospora sediminis]
MPIDDRSRPSVGTEQPPSPAAAGPPTRSWWAPLRALLLRMHFYAGVLVAPFILVAAASGLLYVWTPQVEEIVYDRELHVSAVGGTKLPLEEQVTAARQVLPDAALHAVRPGPGPEDTTRVLFAVEGASDSFRRAVFVDPYTAEVRGSLTVYGSSGALPVRTWTDLLHRNLHLGDAGRLYSELAASWMWLIAAGGAALWISRRRRKRRIRTTLLPEPKARGIRRTMSFHGSLGLWLLIGLFCVSATGLTWSQFAGSNVTAIREALSWQTPAVSTEAPPEPDARSSGDVGVDRVLQAGRAAGLAGPVEVVYPAGEDAAYTVTQLDKRWPTRVDSVAVDPAEGTVTDEVRFADYPLMAKLARWGVDAHMGMLFGVANQLVLTALVVGLMTVIVLGYRMWWRRRPAQSGLRTLGPPVARGSWSALPWQLKCAVAAVTVAIGVLMPVLGVSLVVFLVLDAVLALRSPSRSAAAPPASPPPRT